MAHAEACQVKDDVDAGDRLGHRGAVPNVRDHETAAIRIEVVQVLAPAVDEVVDDDDVGPALDELAHQFRADESGAAGDENG
jgi:hypothetical protein